LGLIYLFMELLIIGIVFLAIIRLGAYALDHGRQVEEMKKFKENLKKFDLDKNHKADMDAQDSKWGKHKI